MAERIPLFPLGQPLFPGVRLRLQIFEQRYLSLVRNSVREDSAFGIVGIARGQEALTPTDSESSPDIYKYGLEVKIVDWNQQQNGLLGISVAGERRFCIEEASVAEDGLLIAEVEWLPSSTSSVSIPPENTETLEKLLRELLQHPALDWVELPEETLSEDELGWKLAQVLPVSVDDKIPLLAETDASKRLLMIQAFVDQLSEA